MRDIAVTRCINNRPDLKCLSAGFIFCYNMGDLAVFCLNTDRIRAVKDINALFQEKILCKDRKKMRVELNFVSFIFFGSRSDTVKPVSG